MNSSTYKQFSKVKPDTNTNFITPGVRDLDWIIDFWTKKYAYSAKITFIMMIMFIILGSLYLISNVLYC